MRANAIRKCLRGKRSASSRPFRKVPSERNGLRNSATPAEVAIVLARAKLGKPCRPHQGIGNRLIDKENDEEELPVVSLDEVRCQTRLGGLLKHYYRAA